MRLHLNNNIKVPFLAIDHNMLVLHIILSLGNQHLHPMTASHSAYAKPSKLAGTTICLYHALPGMGTEFLDLDELRHCR